MDMCKDVSLAGSFHHLRWSPSLPEGGNRYARNSCFLLFLAYTRKGGFVLQLSLGLLLNPRSCPCGHPTGSTPVLRTFAQDDA